ncbi:MAG: transposase, partial [Candidatus Atribacteria bacterium]|nr:transposase [Candidatus Atribacteria bacterium]
VLRTMGLKHEPHFTNFHRVLNRNRWSPLSASRLRFHLLLDLLPSSQSVVIGIDETLERRKGKRGRKPEKGVRLPHLATIANNPHQPGETKEIHWYGESQRLVRIIEYYVMRWNGEVTFEE